MDPSRMERVKIPFLQSDYFESLTSKERCLVDNSRSVVLSCKTVILYADIDVRGLLPFHPERLKTKMLEQERM